MDSTGITPHPISERDYAIAKLTKVGGVSPRSAAAFYEMGVRTYKDLVEYLRQHSAEDVSSDLKEHGLNRPAGLINMKEMTRQAEMLSLTEFPDQVNEQPVVAQKPAEKSDEGRSSRSLSGHDAIFTVSFDVVEDEGGKPMLKTTVYHEEDSGEEQVFQGSDASLWVNWMLGRANLSQNISDLQIGFGEQEAEIGRERSDVQVAVQSVQITSVGPSSDDPEKKLMAVMSFQLLGSDALSLTTQNIPYRLNISMKNLTEGTLIRVASEEGRLEPNILEYAHQIEFALPKIDGRYQLYSNVWLPPSAQLKSYYEGPTFRITP